MVKWSTYERLLNGWVPKLSLFVPLIGYLLLFNDGTSSHLSFDNLSGTAVAKIENWKDLFSNIGFYSDTVRLRFLYFGFLFLGAANLLFIVGKPEELQLGSDIVTYKKTSFDHYTTTEFCKIQKKITEHADETVNNAVNDIEWNSFYEATVAEESDSAKPKVGSWEEAKQTHKDVLSVLLGYNFHKQDTSRPWALIPIVILGAFGYLCLLAPSFDLFIKVMKTIFP